MSTSKQLDASAYELGAGASSVPEAVNGATSPPPAAPTSASTAGRTTTNEPVTRTVTYTNSSDAAVELSAGRARARPTGVATLADSTLTVPAHGTASTTVTGDGAKAAGRQHQRADRRLGGGRNSRRAHRRSAWSRRRSGTRSPST